MKFDLNDALNNGLPTIMEDLYKKQKCDRSKYNIKLMTHDAGAEVYSETYDIILCLYYNDKCISSVIGRYNSNDKSMEILSKTNKDFEKRKYNLYLRTCFIYLMCFAEKDIDTIFSFSENPISTYTMYKYYHASNPELHEYLQDNDLTPENFTLEDAKDFHEDFKERTLDELEEQLLIKSPEELGYKSKEDAIEITSKAISIPLYLSLKEYDVKTKLLSILQNIKIQCDKKPTIKKCVSSCRGQPEKECNPSRCKYINTKKYNYCRLSAKYKMNPSSCRVSRKLKKKEVQPHAEKVIQQFLMKHKKDNKTLKATEKIGRFMRKTTQKRRARFLKAICQDSGVCIAFGKEDKKISVFFNHFVNFDFVKKIKRIGMPSANGFVNEIEYKKHDYLAHAVLKSSTSEKADNLAYEYLVGQFINKKTTHFPCFLETYGLYQYTTEYKWNHIKNTTLIQSNVLKDSLQNLDDFDASIACKNSKYLAILIQHIKNAEPLSSFLEKGNINLPFLANELTAVLYQIYFPLCKLASEFTHYDLHTNNVLIYTPIQGKYIHYHYHFSDKIVVEFYSTYIAKIIDYGRSYFKDGTKSSTKLLDEELCTNRDCDPECGEDYGFSWFDKKLYEDNNFISAYHNNQSHDLRLMRITDYLLQQQISPMFQQLKSNVYYQSYIEPIATLLKKTKYGVGIHSENNKYFGTRPNLTPGLPNAINNVKDVEKGLRTILTNSKYKKLLASNIQNKQKLGDLHVYSDRPMNFIPFP